MAERRLRYTIADRITEADTSKIIKRALTGDASAARTDNRVIWDDGGDQVLLHVDTVVVKLVKRFVFVSADFETDQTGRGPLIVALAFGSTEDGAGLVATTDEQPHGHPVIAARWGRIFQQVVWTALLSAARAHATERGKAPQTLHVLNGALRFGAAAPVDLRASALESFDKAFPGARARMRK